MLFTPTNTEILPHLLSLQLCQLVLLPAFKTHRETEFQRGKQLVQGQRATRCAALGQSNSGTRVLTQGSQLTP